MDAKVRTTALDRYSFAEEFDTPASTIRHADRFNLHVRAICVDERNFPALFGLDKALINRQGQYRRDGISPTITHLTHSFMQAHAFHLDDQRNHNRRQWKYLPSKPHIDKAGILIHDEGEDTIEHNRQQMREYYELFIQKIENYIDAHNETFPELRLLTYPTAEEIEQMYKEIPDLIEPFGLMSKKFKGEPSVDTYIQYLEKMLLKDMLDLDPENPELVQHLSWAARAVRQKLMETSHNGATYTSRSEAMLKGELSREDYRDWVNTQINRLRVVHLEHDFEIPKLHKEFHKGRRKGFTGAAAHLFPDSQPLIKMMRQVIERQLQAYSYDLANENGRLGTSPPNLQLQRYDKLSLSQRTNMITLTQQRLAEVKRMDREPPPQGVGMYGLPFREIDPTGGKTIPLAKIVEQKPQSVLA